MDEEIRHIRWELNPHPTARIYWTLAEAILKIEK
jgi:hypothetical protein